MSFVDKINVNLVSTCCAKVEFFSDADDIDEHVKQCEKVILELGYNCEILKVKTPLNISFKTSEKKKGLENRDLSDWRNLFFISLLFTVPQVIIHYSLHHVDASPVDHVTLREWSMFLLAIPVQFYVGKRFYISAYKSFKHGVIGMNALIVLGTSYAFLYSTIVFVYQLTCSSNQG